MAAQVSLHVGSCMKQRVEEKTVGHARREEVGIQLPLVGYRNEKRILVITLIGGPFIPRRWQYKNGDSVPLIEQQHEVMANSKPIPLPYLVRRNLSGRVPQPLELFC